MGRKINLSEINPAKRSRSGPNSVYVDRSMGDNVQRILGAIGPFWPKWRLRRVPRSPSFFCLVNHATFRQLRNGRFSPNLILVAKRSSMSSRGTRKDIFENFHFRSHLPPKSEIENRSNRHLTQSRHRSRDALQRDTLLYVVVQRPGSFRGPVNFSLRRTIAELRGVKFAQFLDFCLFPHTKPLKRTFR